MNRKGYRRVTEILSAIRTGLSDYMDRGGEQAEATVYEKASYGTQVHEACEAYNKVFNNRKKREAFKYDFSACFPDVEKAFAQYRKWADRTLEKVIAAEMEVWHDTYKYVGHFDICAIVKGDPGPSIIDIKTPASPSKTWDLQLSAYLKAYNWWRLAVPGKDLKFPETNRVFALLVHTNKVKAIPPKEDIEYLFGVFLAAIRIKNFMG